MQAACQKRLVHTPSGAQENQRAKRETHTSAAISKPLQPATASNVIEVDDKGATEYISFDPKTPVSSSLLTHMLSVACNILKVSHISHAVQGVRVQAQSPIRLQSTFNLTIKMTLLDLTFPCKEISHPPLSEAYQYSSNVMTQCCYCLLLQMAPV